MTDCVKKNANSTIRVDEQDDAQVLISPENEDRFVLTCAQTVRAVMAGMSVEVLIGEVQELFKHVAALLSKQEHRVRDCYAMPRQGELTFFVVPKSDNYDFELADVLSDIDIEIAEKFQQVPCSVQQIPAGNVNVFVTADARKFPLHEPAENA